MTVENSSDELPEAPKNDDVKQVDITRYADRWYEIRALKRIADDSKKAYESARDAIKAYIGDADEILIHGKTVATHPRGAFNRAKFLKENPVIAGKYMRHVMTEVFDEEMFAESNPGLYRAYRTRSLRAKDGE